MDAAAQLALMVKAKAVFGAPDTFLSFPVSPLPYTKRQLDFYAQSNASEVAESLQHLHAFSTLVNLVPGGVALFNVCNFVTRHVFTSSFRICRTAYHPAKGKSNT